MIAFMNKMLPLTILAGMVLLSTNSGHTQGLLDRPAGAEQSAWTYVEPSYPRIINTLIRMGGLDLERDEIIDEYARVQHCDLYEHYYKDEFTWRQVREGIREKIDKERDSFPIRYQIVSNVQLGRYDFDKGGFRLLLDRRGRLHSINVLPLTNGKQPRCGDLANYEFLKINYLAALRRPIVLVILPMAPEEADALRTRMEEAGNTDRVLRMRINVSLINLRPDLNDKGMNSSVYFSAHPDSIELFEDREMTKRIRVFLGKEQQQVDQLDDWRIDKM